MDSPKGLSCPPNEPSGTPRPTSDGAAHSGFGLRWIPVRVLAARHRPRIRGHLLALDEHSRYLRFGYLANDSQIGHYVDSLDFQRDEVFGVFNRRLDLIAMAHLAYFEARDGVAPCAEFGVSVAQHQRGRGFGERLFDHAALHARNRGIDRLRVHALSENTAMLRIARNAGAQIVREGPESQACVQLAPDSLASRLEAMVEDRAADLDYGLKLQAQRVDGLLSNWSKD